LIESKLPTTYAGPNIIDLTTEEAELISEIEQLQQSADEKEQYIEDFRNQINTDKNKLKTFDIKDLDN
jgi:hypothetical protein